MQDSTSHQSVNTDDSIEGRASARDFYDNLSGSQRHDLVIESGFRDLYNELTRAHERQFRLSTYYFEKWRPQFTPVEHSVYEELRRKIYFNPRTGERRETVYIKQEQLASAIGVKDRKTIRKALRKLEGLGFIERDYSHYIDPKSGRAYRGADKFTVWWEIPLTPDDAVEMLVKEAIRTSEVVKRKKSPLQIRDPKTGEIFDAVKGKSSPLHAEEKIPSKENTLEITKNVQTFETKAPTERGVGTRVLAKDPRVAALTPSERAEREQLVDLCDEVLKKLEGDRSVEPHRNFGLFRRIAMLLPSQRTHEALAATQDAVQRERAGDGKLHKTPSHYFAGVVRNIAAEEGIDLGIRWSSERPDEAVTP